MLQLNRMVLAPAPTLNNSYPWVRSRVVINLKTPLARCWQVLTCAVDIEETQQRARGRGRGQTEGKGGREGGREHHITTCVMSYTPCAVTAILSSLVAYKRRDLLNC